MKCEYIYARARAKLRNAEMYQMENVMMANACHNEREKKKGNNNSAHT